jgi:hypothetical protein
MKKTVIKHVCVSLRSIYDLRKWCSALFRLLLLNYLFDLAGEIQRLQYFDRKLWKLSGEPITIVRFILLRKTAHHNESDNLKRLAVVRGTGHSSGAF